MRISDWSSDVCSSDLRGLSACGIEPGTMDSGNRAGVIGDGCDNRRPGRPAIRDIVLGGAVIAVRVKPKRVGAGSVQDASAKEEIGRASCRERVCQYV